MAEQRLIDAFAFRRELDNYFPFTKDEQHKHGIADMAKSTVLYVLEKMPTIEERKTGKWVGIKEYCDYLNEKAEREGKGKRYMPSGMNIHVYCNQCWEPNDRRTTYCPNCSARMVQEGEDNGFE